MKIVRHPANPIVEPGKYEWRKVATFNPGVLLHDGYFYLYERAAGSLRPFKTSIGVMRSKDGVSFEHVKETPVFTGEMLGLPGASIEDARMTKIEGKIYMVYAMQPHEFDCWPSGEGVPDYQTYRYKGWNNFKRPMITQSGIAVSDDGINFTQLGYTTPVEIDDRDNALFPEKINGKYALLRRPIDYVGDKFGTNQPGIWISYSDDLVNWDFPRLIATAQNEKWEGTKIGASTTPVKTEEGWLLLFHGVDHTSTYRVGAMLLDLENPEKVIGRTNDFIMEPEFYYEKFGLIIPRVVFPTDNVIKDGTLYIYYGCCDTSIGLATVQVEDLVAKVMKSHDEI